MAQGVAQELSDATARITLGPILYHMQAATQANVDALTRQLAPILTTALILSRATPGQPLTAEQEAKLTEVLGSGAQDMLKGVGEALPEDPQVVQLRRIAQDMLKGVG